MDTPLRRSSTARNLVVVALVVGAAYFVPNLLNRVTDALFFPWAHAEPPLLDAWVGELTAGDGSPLALGMTLQRDLTDKGMVCNKCNQIDGSAITCSGPNERRQYRISGSPRDRQGQQVHLGVSPVRQPPPDGLELSTLSGTWDGQDILELQADFFWRRNGAAVSASDDPATQPVPIRLERQRMTAFEAKCATLRSARPPR